MKRIQLLLIVAWFMMTLCPNSVWALGGSGTSGSPYTIANASDLVAFASKVNGGETGAYAKLTANITLTGTWTPIGNSSKIYTGTFDGQGYTISGLNLTATAANAGLFGYVNGATIKNFTLAGSVSSGYDNTGSVVGYAKGSSTIQDIVSTVNITMTAAKSHLGGIAGNIENGTSVLGCTYSGTLNAGSSTDSNGGIVGFAHANCSGTIQYCFFNGMVKTTGSGPQMGGILGYTNDENNNFGGVQDCYSCGTLTFAGSDTHVNAIVGRIRNRANTTINNTYLSGTATRACNTDGPSIPASNKAITISVTAGTGGSVTKNYVNPTSTKATQLQVVAKSNYGYKFDKWKDGNTQATRDVALSDNVSLQAIFSIKKCTIRVVVDDASRGYAYIGMSGVTSVTVDQGTEVTIVARVRVGFEFLYWTDNSTESEHKITADYDRTYTAYFRTARYYITVEAGEHGSVDRTSGEREHGTNMYVTATPDEGYHFEKWSDGNTTNPRNIHVTAPGTYKAIFAPNKYTITVNTANSYMGTVSGGGTFNYGSTKTITATPKTGYRFVEWNDGNTNASRQITVTEDKTYTATFAIYQHTITVKTNDSNYGTVSGGGTFDYNSSKTITATPKEHYHFVKWNDGNTNASRQITVTEDKTYTATFAIDQHTITVEANDNNMGTVSGGGTYNYGSTKTITATPKTGYHFVKWNDGNTDASRQITVTGDATYTATFAPNQYTITVEANDNNMGTVSGGGTYNYGSQQTIKATPKTGYHFVKWNDGNTDASRQITVTEDKTYIATYFYKCGPRAIYNNGTLTFYNDSIHHEGINYELNTDNNTPGWQGYSSSTTLVVFDASFASVRPTSCFHWFYNYRNLGTVTGLEYLNTENVTNMSGMFRNCSSLQSLDLSSFNTSNVTDMREMFSGCSWLDSLDLSGFNTDSVTTMAAMFRNCSSLQSLDLSGFNTENVTDMREMFSGCSLLKSLDLSGFNTENVTDMSLMFFDCSSLESLDLSGFNTDSVTNMKRMFYNCSSLQSLDLSSFNTSNVTDMREMFSGCSWLESLDLSGFNTDSATTMAAMFRNCSSLQSLDLSSFNTSNVTDMSEMFRLCRGLSSLTIGNFDMQKATTDYTFGGCPELNTLTLKSLPYLSISSDEDTPWDSFEAIFSGDGVTVNYELDDNSVIYTGTNYLPAATNATYSRTMPNEWGTFVVPFSLVADDSQGYAFYELTGADNESITLTQVANGTEVAAGTPLLVRMMNGKRELLVGNSNNPAISTQVQNGSAAGGFCLAGTFSRCDLLADDYFIANNLFWRAGDFGGTGAAVAPFRAYLKSMGSANAPARFGLRIAESESVATGMEALNAITAGEATYYNVQGHRLSRLQPGLNIVVYGNGQTQKVIIR